MEWQVWITSWIIFCIRYSKFFWVYHEKYVTLTENLSMRKYVYKIENKITVRIKKGYYLELLTSETVKLLGSTKCKINKGENDENIPHFENTEVVLVHYNIVNKI